MKFIFPRNYKYRNKIFGILDYSTAIINLIFYIIIYFILNIFSLQIKIKIFLFVLICFPFFLLSIINSENENIFSIIKYLIKYLKSKKLYLYK